MIPATLIDNPTLHSIILTQIILETLTGETVPRAPQGNTFTYHMNGKEVMMFDKARKNEKQVEGLEKETGVNLDHYHKLNIRN
jgi:flagellum-specific peptidoglycan hydrolase FlgJ